MISKNKIQEYLFRVRDKVGLLEAPEYIYWVSTHKCNLNCKHCMLNARRPLKDELSTDEVKKFIKDISQMGVKYFFISGGEPLLRDDLFEIIDYANRHKLKTGISTNGILIPIYKEKILSSKLTSIMISLDGLENTYKKIRGNNINYNQLLESINFLKRNCKFAQISVCTTVNKYNFQELDKLKDLILSYDINLWRINITLPRGRTNKDMILDNKELKQLIDFIKENSKQIKISLCSEAGYLGDSNKEVRGSSYFFCSCSWTSCALMANGDIMGCPIYENNSFVEGNIRDISFKKIWDRGLCKFRNIPLNSTCSKCKYLPKCGGGCKVMRILGKDCLVDDFDGK